MPNQATTSPYRSEALIALLTALMIGLAGCGSAIAGLPFTAPDPYTETGAALNGSTLANDHRSALTQDGSYSSVERVIVTSDQRTLQLATSTAVDRSTSRSLRRFQLSSNAVDGDGLNVTTYTNGSVTDRRLILDIGDQQYTRYDAARAPYSDGLLAVRPADAADPTNTELIETVIHDVNWTQRGVERYEGGWVTRYDAIGADNFTALRSSALADQEVTRADRFDTANVTDIEVTSINATLLVAPDGIVRRIHVQVDGSAAGTPVQVSMTIRTDGRGPTVIEEPNWPGHADP